MFLLVVGLLVFFGIHLVPKTALKPQLVGRYGANRYKIGFAVISAIGLLLIIVGYVRSETVHFWAPPGFAYPLMILAMLPVIMLMGFKDAKTDIRRWIKHPMSTAILAWGILHLFMNGDLASILLFGCFAAYALLDMITASSKPVAKDTPSGMKAYIKPMAIGAVIYVVLIFTHGYFTGMHLI